MRKLWCNSILVAAVWFTVGCKSHTATETDQTSDTSAMQVDSSLTPSDHTDVDIDTVSLNDSIKGNPVANPASTGDSKLPGSKPKPGKMSHVDSIKASYPKKK